MSAEAITLAIAPKVGGFLSVLGSTWIFAEVLGDGEKRKVVYHRLMFMFSFFDIIVSSAAFASTWSMIPDGNAWNAIGNQATCNMQGFALQLGSTLFTYNAFLSIFYVLVINYNVPDSKLMKYEWSLHIFPISFGLITAIIPLANSWYHNANLWCWIAVSPECQGDAGELDPACAEYDNIHIYRWVFFFAPLWFCFVLQLLCLCFVFRGVRYQEKQSLQYQMAYQNSIRSVTASQRGEGVRNGPDQSENPAAAASLNNLPRTRQVGGQAMLYILAFYMTYIFATVNRIMQQATGSSPVGILIMHSLTLPMQGFWNFLIYRRPQYLRQRRSGRTRCESIMNALVLTCFRNWKAEQERTAQRNRIQQFAGAPSSLSRLSISRLSMRLATRRLSSRCIPSTNVAETGDDWCSDELRAKVEEGSDIAEEKAEIDLENDDSDREQASIVSPSSCARNDHEAENAVEEGEAPAESWRASLLVKE